MKLEPSALRDPQEHTENPDPLLTLAEVGHLLGRQSVRTVRRMIQRKELPQPCRVGRRPVLPRSEVSAFIEKAKAKRNSGGSRS